MTACVNCDRALQPAWKYCIYCGTRTAVAATAPRSRPLPNPAGSTGVARRAPARTPVPSTFGTGAMPIVPASAPAPLAAAPARPPVSSEWPESLGEKPSMLSSLHDADVPPPVPPAAPIPAPEAEDGFDELDVLDELDAAAPVNEPVGELEAPEAEAEAGLGAEVEAEPEPDPEPEPEPELDPEPDPDPEPEPEPEHDPEPIAIVDRPSRRPRAPGRRPAASGTLLEEAPAEVDDQPEAESVTRVDRTGRVNVLAVLALLLGLLACPLAALFGHVALSQLKTSGERGVIPSWAAIVLGYLWLGFFLVLGITYLATNG